MPTTTYICETYYYYYTVLTKNRTNHHLQILDILLSFECLLIVSFTIPLCTAHIFDDLLRVSNVFDYLFLQLQIQDMKTGPKPIGGMLIPNILQVLEEAGADVRAWTVTVRLRKLLQTPHLRWETVHKYLEQMTAGQMIFRYEDPSGIVTYSKNPIIREKVLF